MGIVIDVVNTMLNLLKGFVPVGIDPIYFWLTAVISFCIIFLLLQALPFFKESRGIAFVVAAVMAYFVSSSAFATIVISKLFPSVGLVIVGILGLLLVIAFLSPDAFEGGLQAAPFIAIVAFVIIIYMTYSSVAPDLQKAGFISGGLGTSITTSDIALVIAIIIVIGILWAVLGGKKEEGEGLGSKIMASLFKKGW